MIKIDENDDKLKITNAMRVICNIFGDSAPCKICWYCVIIWLLGFFILYYFSFYK